MTNCRRLGFLGIKGGVGTSLLCALAARYIASRKTFRVALVDFSPASFQPAYLSLRNHSRSLAGLQRYEGPLGPKILETYFAASPEGVLYLPAIGFDLCESPLPLIERMLSSFDLMLFDLSIFDASPEQFERLGFCQRFALVTSTEPLCLASTANFQTQLATRLDGFTHLHWAINQNHPKHHHPKDASVLPKGSNRTQSIPYAGDDIGLLLKENPALPNNLEKSVKQLVDDLLDETQPWREPSRLPITLGLEKETEKENIPTFDFARLSRVQELHQQLLQSFRDQGLLQGAEESGSLKRDELEPRAKGVLEDILARESGLSQEERALLVSETLQLAFGLGPLEPFLKDPTITEIMVNGPHQVYVERGGRLETVPVKFLGDQQLRTSIERILSPIGRRLDESQPYVDGRLPDGSRVNAVLPPVSLDGPILTIRKFSQRQLTAEDLVRIGSLTPEASTFLGACVKARKNIVVSGGTGSGKTTLLNILSCFIPESERIVTIEDSAELRLSQDHVVRLETRPANLEGKGRIAIRDLVINALRMRPDRIVVGEVRGGEALDMLQAMNTGHDGSLTTCHANTPRDALSRLETMCLMSGLDLPLRAVREQVVRAVHLVVQQSRLPNGKRAVTHIAEVRGLEGETPVLQDLFKWNEDKIVLERLPFKASFENDRSNDL
jgi:pilus assembly protein CpaF